MVSWIDTLWASLGLCAPLVAVLAIASAVRAMELAGDALRRRQERRERAERAEMMLRSMRKGE